MPIQTPLKGIKTFCVAAKCLSFKHAAQQLFITPSAVSHQIKDLEQQLGCLLFERKVRQLALTSKGYAFLQQIEPAVQQLETIITDFSLQQQNRAITISLPEFFASEIFIPLLSAWTQSYPDIDLKLDTTKDKHNQAPGTDLSVVLSSSIPNLGKATELFPLYYVAAVNQTNYSQWKNQGFTALNQLPLILHQARPWAWHQWAEKQGVEDFSPKQIIQFDSMYGVARAAQQGLGIALVPLPNCRGWLQSEQLVKLFDQELHTRDKYFLVQHEFSPHRGEIPTFIDWLTTRLTQL